MRKRTPSAKNNNQKKTIGSLNMQMLASAHYSSPLPPASEMEHYEAIYPGFTKILMERYVKQSEHRMELENKVIDSGIKNTSRGQIFAFILALTTISIGAFLLYLNKDAYGILSILGALATLVGVFIYGNKSKKNERIQKARENPDL